MEVVFILIAFVLEASGRVVQIQQNYETGGYNKSYGAFTWRNCDMPHLPLTFTKVNMLPDPLQMAGETSVYIQFTMWFNLTTELGADNNHIEVDLSLRLKTPTGYIDVCEYVGERFCHYNDLCSVLEEVHVKCKKDHIPVCNCPLQPQSYTLLPVAVSVTPLPFLLKGTFEATAFIKQQGKNVGCLEVHFCVTECMFDET